TCLKAKDARYILPLTTPLTCLAALAIDLVSRAFDRALAPRSVRVLEALAMALLLVAQAYQAWRLPVDELRGVRAITDFLRHHAPDEAVLYDGYHEGAFVFYVQAGDPEFRQRVVRGDKLLYTYGLHMWKKPREFVATRDEVIERLQRHSGCRWLAIEDRPPRQ